jgi:hypothetical protein
MLRSRRYTSWYGAGWAHDGEKILKDAWRAEALASEMRAAQDACEQIEPFRSQRQRISSLCWRGSLIRWQPVSSSPRGTLTQALPVHPGGVWSTAIQGIEIPGLEVRFT